jgi:hypothetical protein
VRSTCFEIASQAPLLALLALTSPVWAQHPQVGAPRTNQPGQRSSAGPAAAPGSVQQANHLQFASDPVVTGETAYYDGGEPLVGEAFGESCGPGGCTHCGRFGCNGCGPFGQGCLSGLFVRADYLFWDTKGMNLPPLVTTSPDGTPRVDAGVLGEDGTIVLFGDEQVGGDMRSGGRITFGRWFDPCQRLGIEAEYFGLKDESTSFSASSEGDPILARPFFDTLQGTQSADLIAFPNVIQGTIAIDHLTSFQGAGVRALYNLCCGDGCGMSCVTGCPVQTGYRFDVLMGYRFLRLDDRLDIVEDSTSLESTLPGSFFIRDHFSSENQFHGWDFGTALHFCKGCWSLDLLSKLAIGNTRSTIAIDGSTIITEQGQSQAHQGGILALGSNIGTYQNDDFSVVPELGATVGYQLNPCWRVTLGYTFIYWSKVFRAGDAIDLDVNPNLFPPVEEEVDDNLRPEFRLICDDFWAQGMNVGLEGKW